MLDFSSTLYRPLNSLTALALLLYFLYKSINSSFRSWNHCFLLWNCCLNHSTCSVFWLEVWLASLASGLCFAGNKCNPSGRLSAVVLASLSISGLRLHVWRTPTNFIGPFELFQVHTRRTHRYFAFDTLILSDPFTNWTCFLHYGIVACVAARFFLRNSCPGPKVSCVTCDSTCNKQWNLVYLSCMQRSCNSCTPVSKYSSELYILLWPLHLSISLPSSHR